MSHWDGTLKKHATKQDGLLHTNYNCTWVRVCVMVMCAPYPQTVISLAARYYNSPHKEYTNFLYTKS